MGLPVARLDIKASAVGSSDRTGVLVVVDGVPVAELPATSVELSYQHNEKSIVKVGVYRADIDFKGIPDNVLR